MAGQHQRAAQVLRVVAGGEGADAERLVDHLNRQAGRRIARVAVVVASTSVIATVACAARQACSGCSSAGECASRACRRSPRNTRCSTSRSASAWPSAPGCRPWCRGTGRPRARRGGTLAEVRVGHEQRARGGPPQGAVGQQPQALVMGVDGHGAGDLGGLIRRRFSIWPWGRACPRFGHVLAKRRIAAKAAATQERVTKCFVNRARRRPVASAPARGQSGAASACSSSGGGDGFIVSISTKSSAGFSARSAAVRWAMRGLATRLRGVSGESSGGAAAGFVLTRPTSAPWALCGALGCRLVVIPRQPQRSAHRLGIDCFIN